MFTRIKLVTLILAASLAVAAAVPASADPIPANSGLPGSACEPTNLADSYTADPTTSSTALGPDAPAFYELGMPTATYKGKAPKAVMLLIHGGGWFRTGKDYVAGYRSAANDWRSRGWMTVNLDYRGCDKSLADVLWFMKRVRELHPTRRVCAAGASAGGHLALLLASVRPDLACVIALAAPTDFASLPSQLTWDPDAATYTTEGAQLLAGYAQAALGTLAPLEFSSPRRYVKNIRARVLIASCETDVLVPRGQTYQFVVALKKARPLNYVDGVILKTGDNPFVHSGISDESVTVLTDHINKLVWPVVAP